MVELPRRAFLRQLTTLPLIGGAVNLIGNPTAAAVPVTRQLLQTYEQWLGLEQCRVSGLYRRLEDRVPDLELLTPELVADLREFTSFPFYARNTAGRGASFNFHCNSDGTARGACPSTRAALVLSAVGCDWREG